MLHATFFFSLNTSQNPFLLYRDLYLSFLRSLIVPTRFPSLLLPPPTVDQDRGLFLSPIIGFAGSLVDSMTFNFPALLQHHPFVRCEPQYGAIICLICNQGYPLGSIKRHLVENHGIPHKVYHPVFQSFERQYPSCLAQSWKDISLPVDGSIPIEGLKILPGYCCSKCGLKTESRKIANKHKKKCSGFDQTSLQCWNETRKRIYWTVQIPVFELNNSVSNLSVGNFKQLLHPIDFDLAEKKKKQALEL